VIVSEPIQKQNRKPNQSKPQKLHLVWMNLDDFFTEPRGSVCGFHFRKPNQTELNRSIKLNSYYYIPISISHPTK
jgi:hypothetical protein